MKDLKSERVCKTIPLHSRVDFPKIYIRKNESLLESVLRQRGGVLRTARTASLKTTQCAALAALAALTELEEAAAGGLESYGLRPSQVGSTQLDDLLRGALSPAACEVVLASAAARRALTLRGRLTPAQFIRLDLRKVCLHDGVRLLGSTATLCEVVLQTAEASHCLAGGCVTTNP